MLHNTLTLTTSSSTLGTVIMSSDPPVDQPMSSETSLEQSAQSSSTTQDQTSLPADIRHQVEQEQALADAQKRLKELEADNERLQKEKKEVEEARDGSGELLLSLGRMEYS
jgi:nucleoprotein TPR